MAAFTKGVIACTTTWWPFSIFPAHSLLMSLKWSTGDVSWVVFRKCFSSRDSVWWTISYTTNSLSSLYLLDVDRNGEGTLRCKWCTGSYSWWWLLLGGDRSYRSCYGSIRVSLSFVWWVANGTMCHWLDKWWRAVGRNGHSSYSEWKGRTMMMMMIWMRMRRMIWWWWWGKDGRMEGWKVDRYVSTCHEQTFGGGSFTCNLKEMLTIGILRIVSQARIAYLFTASLFLCFSESLILWFSVGWSVFLSFGVLIWSSLWYLWLTDQQMVEA